MLGTGMSYHSVTPVTPWGGGYPTDWAWERSRWWSALGWWSAVLHFRTFIVQRWAIKMGNNCTWASALAAHRSQPTGAVEEAEHSYSTLWIRHAKVCGKAENGWDPCFLPHNLGPFVFVVHSLVTSPGSVGSLSYPASLFLFGDPRGSWKADSA